MRTNTSSIVIYPALGAEFDLWFARMSGHGLGNCFYNYFHAVVLAQQWNASLISPPWVSLKIGPMLRGVNSKRFYFRMFRPYPGEIFGLDKLFTLLARQSKRAIVELGGSSPPRPIEGALNIVTSRKFTFEGLRAHRAMIRERLIGITRDPLPLNHSWGKGDYVAVHVRLGEFAATTDPKLITSGKGNVRIPLSWYVNVVRALRKRWPDKPVRVFSDGKEQELKPLLELGAVLYQSGSDITDLLAMAGAAIVVGSNSTYSRWAVFLGDMPSIWLQRQRDTEKPSATATPILYVPIDDAEPLLWPQMDNDSSP